VLLLDRALSHPRDSILTSDDVLIIVKFLPTTVTGMACGPRMTLP
jgi:hypothetical protein